MESHIQSNDELAEQFKEMLVGSGHKTALDPEPAADTQDENPLETDFFKALNAFRAARTAGDPEQMARAEEALRDVVRSELTGSAE